MNFHVTSCFYCAGEGTIHSTRWRGSDLEGDLQGASAGGRDGVGVLPQDGPRLMRSGSGGHTFAAHIQQPVWLYQDASLG